MQENHREKQATRVTPRKGGVIIGAVSALLLLVFAVLAFIQIGSSTWILLSKLVFFVLGVLLIGLALEIIVYLIPSERQPKREKQPGIERQPGHEKQPGIERQPKREKQPEFKEKKISMRNIKKV